MSSSSGKRDLGRIDLSRSAPMAVSIKNLDAPRGAQVGGIDLAEHLTRADLQAIEEAWQTRPVIVARRQRLSDPQLLAFSRQFGELDAPGPNPYGELLNKEFPEINVISNVIANGKPIAGTELGRLEDASLDPGIRELDGAGELGITRADDHHTRRAGRARSPATGV